MREEKRIGEWNGWENVRERREIREGGECEDENRMRCV